jgi:hypothetical protein
MNYYSGSSEQPFTSEERVYIEKEAKSINTALRVIIILIVLSSVAFLCGIVFQNYILLISIGLVLLMLLIPFIVLLVKNIRLGRDVSDMVKTVIEGIVSEKYMFHRKDFTSHYFIMNGKNYYVKKEFYDSMSAQEIMEVHIARASKTVLTIKNLSRKTEQKFYEKEDKFGAGI